MVQLVIGIVSLVLAVTIAAPASEGDFYASKYDHLDVDTILNNRRMVNYYAACLLSKGTCPPQGLEFKRILPEALDNNCARCTEKQRTVTHRAIKRLRKEYPKVYAQLTALWDPDEFKVKRFEESFESGRLPPITTTTTAIPFIGDRFGDNEPSSTTPKPAPYPSAATPKSTRSPPIATNSITTTTTTTTNPPIISLTTQRARPPSFASPGANLQATVSFGTNLVGGIVRSLGSFGTQVLETGTKIANAVISAVVRT